MINHPRTAERRRYRPTSVHSDIIYHQLTICVITSSDQYIYIMHGILVTTSLPAAINTQQIKN